MISAYHTVRCDAVGADSGDAGKKSPSNRIPQAPLCRQPLELRMRNTQDCAGTLQFDQILNSGDCSSAVRFREPIFGALHVLRHFVCLTSHTFADFPGVTLLENVHPASQNKMQRGLLNRAVEPEVPSTAVLFYRPTSDSSDFVAVTRVPFLAP